MGRTNIVKKGFAEFFDIPKDILLDMPRIILIGTMQVYIENHRGIIEYQENLIRVSVNRGELHIIGENLMLKNIFSEDIFIDGEIESIQFKS
ncbi:sporulation protein YqfC [Proteinivorax hydrogeniformans]|uniref:Sporulation protein YqfC n=1 Tax=Proteinivorax hydrogeniformans TaxID=1826727 RepID=A0AAU8HWS3_9FIRM